MGGRKGRMEGGDKGKKTREMEVSEKKKKRGKWM